MQTDTGPRLIRIGALVLAVVAAVLLFALPPGLVGYVSCAGTALLAVVVGHRSVRRHGPLLWASITGLVIGYLMLFVSSGLLLVRIARVLAEIG